MAFSGDGATARAPAWKRLGLKLKQDSTPEAAAKETLPVGHPSSSSRTQQSTPFKRKPEAPPAGERLSALKRSRSDAHAAAPSHQLNRKKSVSFGETPTKSGFDAQKPAGNNKPPPKKAKVPGKKQAPAAPPSDIKPALEYLSHWNSARDSWKFNKNHQSTLIKFAFDPILFPSANIDTFYAYIRDLKGYVRTRLQETAMELRLKDSTAGAAGFPEGSVNLPEKQLRYDQVLAQVLHSQAGRKRKTFDEAEYRSSSQDVDDVITRVIKRMRAELVLDHLSDAEETDASTTTTATASSGKVSIADSDSSKTTEGDAKVKLSEGAGKRRRKLRTAVDDSSSSSESDSDSDSSSSSSDDDSDDDDNDAGEAGNGNESSSSSSSSPSSSSSDTEEGSDSDDDSSSEEE